MLGNQSCKATFKASCWKGRFRCASTMDLALMCFSGQSGLAQPGDFAYGVLLYESLPADAVSAQLQPIGKIQTPKLQDVLKFFFVEGRR